MEIPDHVVPREFRELVMREIAEAGSRAREYIEEAGLMPNCPVDDCETVTETVRGLNSHMTSKHRDIPLPDRRKLVELQIAKEAEANGHVTGNELVKAAIAHVNEDLAVLSAWDQIVEAASEISEAEKRLAHAKMRFKELVTNAD